MKPTLRIALLANLLTGAALLSAQTAADTPASPKKDEPVVLDKVEVTAANESPYALPLSSDIGKGGIPLNENPQSIAVVNRALLDDLSIDRLENAIHGVAGVQTGGYYSGWDYLRIRGFDSDFNTYIDGLRGANGMGEETFGLEQIEVIKGPAALYGSGPIGGLVNVVSKRPEEKAFTKIAATVGSYDYYQGTIDFNQPLTSDGSVLFRLNTLYREQGSNIDYIESERFYIAPSLTWKISQTTSITFLSRFRDVDGTFDMPLPAYGTVLPNPNGKISSDFYTGLAGSNQLSETYKQIGYSFIHEFTPDVKLTQNLRYDRYSQTWDDIMYPSAINGALDTIELNPYDYYQKWNDTVVDTRLDFAVETGPIQHSFTGGVDYYRKNLINSSSFGLANIPLNLYNPVYEGVPRPAMSATAYGDDMKEITGLYFQDHLKLPGRVTLTAGGRYDFAETPGVHQEDFTGRLGATWEFVPDAILYTSYSESFAPQSGATVSGDPLKPETGENIEVGLRNKFLEGRLTTTAAIFQLTRNDTASEIAPFTYVYTATGEQRTRGVELDARYSPVVGWEILGAYAYTDSEIVENTGVSEGARMAGVPLHTFDLWTKYTLQDGALRGLGFGIGATHYSSQVGSRDYSAAATKFDLPAYTTWQTALYYRRGAFSTQLNVTNVFDKEYYSGAYNDLYVMPGEPRLFRLTAAWEF